MHIKISLFLEAFQDQYFSNDFFSVGRSFKLFAHVDIIHAVTYINYDINDLLMDFDVL